MIRGSFVVACWWLLLGSMTAQATIFEQAIAAMRRDPQRFDQFVHHQSAPEQLGEWQAFARLQPQELQMLAAMAAYQIHAFPDALQHADNGLSMLPARYDINQYLRLTMAKTLALTALGDGATAEPILQRELAQGGAVYDAMRHSLWYAKGRYEQFIGQGAQALQSLRQAYDSAPEDGVLITRADVAVALGDLLMRSDQFTDAELYYHYADTHYASQQEENGRAEVAVQRSLLLLMSNKLAESRSVLDPYLLYHLARGNRDAIAFGEKIEGCIARAAQQWQQALQHFERSEAIFASTQNRAELHAVQMKKASVLAAIGQTQEALPILQAAVAAPVSQMNVVDRLVAHSALAQISEKAGDFAGAYQHLRERESVQAKMSGSTVHDYRLPRDEVVAKPRDDFYPMLWLALLLAVLLCLYFAWRVWRWRQLAECDESTGLLNSRGLQQRWAVYARRSNSQTIVMIELGDALHWSRLCGYANSELAIKNWVQRLRQQLPASVVMARVDVHRFLLLWPLPASAVHNQLQGLAQQWTRWHLPLPEHMQPINVAMSLMVGDANCSAQQVLSELDGQLCLQQQPSHPDTTVAGVEISNNAALIRL